MAINASAIAGALIFLSFSQVGVAMFISIEEQSQIDIAQIYKAIAAAFGLGFLGSFCISTVCAFEFLGRWGWMRLANGQWLVLF